MVTFLLAVDSTEEILVGDVIALAPVPNLKLYEYVEGAWSNTTKFPSGKDCADGMRSVNEPAVPVVEKKAPERFCDSRFLKIRLIFPAAGGLILLRLNELGPLSLLPQAVNTEHTKANNTSLFIAHPRKFFNVYTYLID